MKKIIMAPPETVWTILTDTTLWPVWGPSVQEVDVLERFIGPGDQGRIKTALGFWVSFEVTEFEPGLFWSWKVGGVQATDHRVRSLGPGLTELEFSSPWWALFYLPVLGLALRRVARLASNEFLQDTPACT